MSDVPKDDDFGLPDENFDAQVEDAFEETIDIGSADQLADDAEIAEPIEDVAIADDEAVIADDMVDVAEEDDLSDDDIEEEVSSEPGLSTAGQYLASSSIAFMVVLAIIGIAFLVLGRFPLEVGCAMIVVPISLVCLACSIVGLLAKPEKREKLLLIPTIGPLLPLATVIVFIIAVLSELKS